MPASSHQVAWNGRPIVQVLTRWQGHLWWDEAVVLVVLVVTKVGCLVRDRRPGRAAPDGKGQDGDLWGRAPSGSGRLGVGEIGWGAFCLRHARAVGVRVTPVRHDVLEASVDHVVGEL